MVGSHINPHTGLHMHTQKDTNYYKLVQQLGGDLQNRDALKTNKQANKHSNGWIHAYNPSTWQTETVFISGWAIYSLKYTPLPKKKKYRQIRREILKNYSRNQMVKNILTEQWDSSVGKNTRLGSWAQSGRREHTPRSWPLTLIPMKVLMWYPHTHTTVIKSNVFLV